MNYASIYEELIRRSFLRQIDEYTERHHILPKCMGGTDDQSNIAVLTAREHFIAHQLLVKMYPGVDKLVYAVNMMCVGDRRTTSRRYEWLRKKLQSVLKSRTVSEETRAKMAAVPKSDKQRAAVAERNKTRVITPTGREAQLRALNENRHKSGSKKGQKYNWTQQGTEVRMRALCCPVECEGVVYESVKAAELAYPGISVRKRLDNPAYPDWKRLRPATKRK